ncbi:DEAD/DEAH box helicase [Candidatus Micrarchaeota archaeon]|nr:DEAD/DEAH box helicase [Candidatus Micrarchaeota archaeon]
MSFDPSLYLHSEVLHLAKRRGFESFTLVQQKAFPEVAAGKNVLVMAPTGFGKTEAAMLPILSKLVQEKGEGVQCLYITPLRALNRDMLSRMEFFCKMLGLRLGVRHGDTTAYERVKQKEQPPHVLITTPESLGALLVAGMRDSLVNVRFVVVDEVHELAYSKRGVQLNLALIRLGLLAPFQVIGLSATVSAPRDVAAFLGEGVGVVDASELRSLDLSVEYPKKAVAMEGLKPDTAARLVRLEQLIASHGKTLVFVNTRFMAEALGALLRPLLGEDFAVHHSSLSKEARLESEEAFKKGQLKALVCTSSLELGMDIGDVDLVVQVGSPRQVTRLVQRVGRSGHKHHLTPKGVVLALDELDELEAKVLVDLAHARLLEPQAPRLGCLDVLAHQICGLALEFGRIRLEGVVKNFRTSRLYAGLLVSVAKKVVGQLVSEGLLAFDGEFLEPTKRTKFYYYENLSTISDLKKVFVKNAESNKNVALLDDVFVSNYLQVGVAFIARGRAWRVLSMVDDELVVEPSKDVSAAIPDWVGEEIPVARGVAAKVAGALSEGSTAFGKKQAAFFVPSASEWVVESEGPVVVVHSFLGHRGNEALAKLLAFSLAAKGKSVRTRAGAYHVLVEFGKSADAEAVAAVLLVWRQKSVAAFLKTHLVDSPLFASRFVHVAKRFGFLQKDRDYQAVSVKKLAAVMKDSVIAEEVFAELFYEKLDVSTLESALSSFRVSVRPSGFSPLARHAVALGGFSELITAAEPTEKVVAAFAEELRSKKIQLHCGYCNQRFTKSLGFLEEAQCLFCGSPRIFPETYSAKKDQRVVMDLVAAYGKNALVALSAYGVGPEAAKRILSRLHKSEDDLFYDLLQAQKDFIRTKKFWKV